MDFSLQWCLGVQKVLDWGKEDIQYCLLKIKWQVFFIDDNFPELGNA